MRVMCVVINLPVYNPARGGNNMKFRFVLLFVLVVGLVAPLSMAQASSSQSSAQSSSPELSKFFAQYFEDERLRDSPEFATNVGRHEYDNRWTDLSKAGRELRRARLEQAQTTVEKYSGSQAFLSEQDQLSVKLLRYDLRPQTDALDLDTRSEERRVGQEGRS